MINSQQQELEDAENLRKKNQLGSIRIEETILTKNEENLRQLIENRSKFFSQDSNNSDPGNKKKVRNFLNEFLLLSKDFDNGKGFLEKISISARLPELAESLAVSFDKMIEKYIPSSPEEIERFNKIKNGGIASNKIKLNGEENLIEQFNREGVDLKFIEEKINTLSIMNPFSKYHQIIPIKLEDGRTLNLDVKKYAKDAFEHYQLKHNEQQNIQPGSTNSHRENQQHNLPGFLALYAKEKFLEKYPQEPSNFFSKNDKKEIAHWQKIGELRDKSIEVFAVEFGFKKSPLQKNPQEQNISEGPPSGPQKSNQEQAPSGPQKSNQEQAPSGPQESNQEQNLKEGPPSGGQERKGILKKPSDARFPNYLPEKLPEKKGVRFGPPQFSPPAESWTQKASNNRSGGSNGRSP
jgi:hypothetical protein